MKITRIGRVARFFRNIWQTLEYTFESDESFYARIRQEDAVIARIMAVVETKPARKAPVKRTKKAA